VGSGADLPDGTSVYLFGSRVDDAAKGGDVDSLIVGPIEDAYSLRRRLTRSYRRQLDEPIDVVILNPDHPDPDTEGIA
jgi:predicted nucleotidyltransferase